MTSFGEKLEEHFRAGRHLCVGIDPHASLLASWELPDSASGAEQLGRTVVEHAAGAAACVKPQIAFFERFGSAGFAALERVLADARSAGVCVIADVKRGDIGSSFAAYADAWLRPGSPLESDAMTVAAYQGFGTLDGAFDLVREHGKGLFVLAATSNPEAADVQRAVRSDGATVAAAMLADARRWNRTLLPEVRVGSVGLVLGATVRLSDYGIDPNGDASAPLTPVLAPGFGFQGARAEDVGSLFGVLSRAVLANESRSLLAEGPAGLRERIVARSAIYAEATQDIGEASSS